MIQRHVEGCPAIGQRALDTELVIGRRLLREDAPVAAQRRTGTAGIEAAALEAGRDRAEQHDVVRRVEARVHEPREGTVFRCKVRHVLGGSEKAADDHVGGRLHECGVLIVIGETAAEGHRKPVREIVGRLREHGGTGQ